ncbi:hypothetical protein R5R35_006563 [Gryllus longicercus]|uniref:Uncharacterized protein n=1 Tax=Gryllus longicercus TaxID=2509291 RepID=A0AAN9Z3K2_9ORTH
MAADGDCPSQFAGQPWSVWTEHLGRDSPISDEEEIERKHQADAMRLPREDMGLFGHCPERDPFYTVVCEFCNTLVKPQGLRNHMDLWHKVTTVESTHGLEPSEKTIKCTVGPKAGPGAKANSGTVKIKVKKPQSSSSTSVPMERLLASNQPHAGSVLPADGVVALSKGADKILLQSEKAVGMGRSQTVSTGPVSLQVAGLDGDGAQLPSPVNGSTTAVPAADLPTSCLGSLPTPMSLSPDPQVNGIQNSSSEPHSPHSPSFPASDPPLITLPDLTIDSFEPVTSLVSLPSKSPVLNSVAHFSPGACHLPRPPEESLEFVPKLEEVTWLRSQPKPLTVCSFSSRKLGGVEANNRRVELFCHGLKTALTEGCLRIPHSILRTAKEKVLAVRHKPVVAKRVVWHS